MDTNEIINKQEEVLFALEELAEANNDLASQIGTVLGITITTCIVIAGYELAVKPIYKKIMQKKNKAKTQMADTEISNDFEFSTE